MVGPHFRGELLQEISVQSQETFRLIIFKPYSLKYIKIRYNSEDYILIKQSLRWISKNWIKPIVHPN